MKKILCILLISLFVLPLSAIERSEHSLSMNVGGPLAIASFEYEFEFIKVNKMSMHFTAGVGSLVLGYSLPIGLTYTYGNENQLLLGVHYVPTYFGNSNASGFLSLSTVSSLIHSFSPRIGIRKIFKVSHEMAYIQTYLSPIFNRDINGVIAWGGVGFGV